MKHHIIFGHAKSNVSDNQFFTRQLESIVSVTHCIILVWVYAEKGIRFLTQTGEKPSQTIDKERLSRERKSGHWVPPCIAYVWSGYIGDIGSWSIK